MKKGLLGGIIKIPAEYRQIRREVKIERIIAPFEWDKAVTRVFCVQCGSLKEIDQRHAQKLLAIIKKSALLADIGDYFFEVSFCEYCPEKDLKVVVKRIKHKTRNG